MLHPDTLFMLHSDTRFLAIPVNHRIAPLLAGAGVTCSMQPAVIYEMGWREDGLNGYIWSTITRVGTKWSRPCRVRTSRGCWAATSRTAIINVAWRQAS